MTSALYEFGGPGTRQTTMRPSGGTAQAPEASGEPTRLPSVYVQSGAVPGLLRTCVVSPELVITVEAPCKERLAPHDTGRGIMGCERGGPSSAVAAVKRRHGERGKLDRVLSVGWCAGSRGRGWAGGQRGTSIQTRVCDVCIVFSVRVLRVVHNTKNVTFYGLYHLFDL